MTVCFILTYILFVFLRLFLYLIINRAIGDVSLQPYVTSEPDIVETNLDAHDEFLVLASDGLWDVLNNAQVAQLLQELDRQKSDFMDMARELCVEALMRGSQDNITVVVVDLRPKTRERFLSRHGRSK